MYKRKLLEFVLLFLFIPLFISLDLQASKTVWKEGDLANNHTLHDKNYPSIWIGKGMYYLEDIYLRQGQQTIYFWANSLAMLKVEVNFGKGWKKIGEGRGAYWKDIPWDVWKSPGKYNFLLRRIIPGDVRTFTFTVHILPEADKFYYDDNQINTDFYQPPYDEFSYKRSNYMTLWGGGDDYFDKPLLIVEGIDAYNNTTNEYYYEMGKGFLNELRANGYDLFFLNWADGGANVKSNAQHVIDALKYIKTLSNNSNVVVAGLSMGGLVSRYALAKAESQNINLNVSHFLSIDSPQQYAFINEELQKFIKDKGNSFAKKGLSCMAAKQLLLKNKFDSNNENAKLINELNLINGNGYPHNCRTIGVSLSNNTSNPYSGKWAEVKVKFGNSSIFTTKKFSMSAEEKLPGSYLPRHITRQTGFVSFGFNYEFHRSKHPTFIPVESALDIRNGASMFDVTIQTENHYFHNELPNEIIDDLVSQLVINKDLVISGNMNSSSYVATKSITTRGSTTWDGSNTTSIRTGGSIILKQGFKACKPTSNNSTFSCKIESRSSSTVK